MERLHFVPYISYDIFVAYINRCQEYTFTEYSPFDASENACIRTMLRRDKGISVVGELQTRIY